MTEDWLTNHRHDFDVLHVHFGLESFSPVELGAALDAAHRGGHPVVHTVHDLDNPQLDAQPHHRSLLDVIVPAADRLVTLTAPAAAQIARRWDRGSTVLAHPTLLTALPAAVDGGASVDDGDDDDDGDTVRVGIHLRDLRPNIDAEGAVRAADRAARQLADEGRAVRIEVLMNERVRDDRAAQRVLAAAEASPFVHLRRTPRLSDAAIEAWLRGLDLFVLPYRHGTHSGWVELCFDLGVRVAGTDVGHFGAQHPADFTAVDLEDARTLADAVRGTVRTSEAERDAVIRARHRERLVERDAVRDAHTALYASALAEVSA